MHTPNEEMIRDRAYALWVEAGSPEGEGQHFWIEAERQLYEEHSEDSSADAAEPGLPPLVPGLPIH